MRYLILFGMLLPLWSCGEVEKIERGPVEHADGNVGVDVAAVQADMRAAQEAEAAGLALQKSLGFAAGVTLSPKKPTVSDVLVASAPVAEGVDGFLDVSFTWYVNGMRVSGVTRDQLRVGTGRFERGDSVHFVARVENQQGHAAEVAASPVEILNAKPEILSDVRNASGLDGLKLEATDPDRDSLRWSVEGGPPGISIQPNGRIRVRPVDLKEAFSGEVVFVAEDPQGARAELHIPVSVNAAQAARTEVEEVKTTRTREQMTDEEFEKANLESGARIEKMSAEELDRYLLEQERRAK